MKVIPLIYYYNRTTLTFLDGFRSILFESLIFPTCLDLRFFHRKTFLKRHWCTLYDHLRMLLPFGRYFQTNCCIMCRKNIFDKHILYMYDSLKKWPLPIKDNIRDNDFELPRISTFMLTSIHTHCYSHLYTHQKLGKRQRHGEWDS